MILFFYFSFSAFSDAAVLSKIAPIGGQYTPSIVLKYKMLNAGKYREIQGNTGKFREIQGNSEKCREMQRNVEKCREMQRNAGECSEM